MRIPEFLKDGGTIGFAAPSFGCNIEPYKSGFINAQKKFTEMGYKLEIGENCYKGCGVGISNTPEKCGKELNSFMEGKSDVVISCGGGELMCEVLDYVNFKNISERKPIWYMGFSDNTNMTFLLPTLCDTAAIYGPCAPAFGMRKWHKSIQDAFDIITNKTSEIHGYDMWEKESLKTEKKPLEPYNVTEKKEIKYYNCDNIKDGITGRLIGGCLDCLSILVGTKYDKVAEFNERYKEDGIIWFMESCDLNVMGIRRALWQLKHAGWFKYVKCFLIGRPLCFGEELFGLDQYEAVMAALGEYNVPVIMDLDIGHLPPMMPLITGAMANFRAEGNKSFIRYLI